MKYILALIVACAMPLSARAVTIDLVPVGNPNNTGEIQGAGIFGHVTTSYRIGKTEVTNAQYVEFLNAKAATDTMGLYNTSMNNFSYGGITRSGISGSYTYAVKATAPGVGPGGTDYTYGDKPVNLVSWYDAIRFANWMNNGQGTASTETGTYTISGGTAIPMNPDSIMRNAGATWFLPTENEWYKAAYYNGATATYYDYPTSSDATPNNNLPSADTGNSANFLTTVVTTGDPGYPMTAAGAYLQSDSPYGTFDQGGNVAEWNETLASAGKRVRRGGSWNLDVSALASATRESVTASTENSSTGFRLATLPAGVPGDYNGNGVVDGADYVVWREHFGMTYQLQNEVASTSPGSVMQDDYNEWRSRFGNTSGAGAGSGLQNSSVPEPTACGLAVAAIAMIAAARVRRSRD